MYSKHWQIDMRKEQRKLKNTQIDLLEMKNSHKLKIQ